MRNWCKRKIDWLFDKSSILSIIGLVGLSAAGIFNLNNCTINVLGAEEFKIGFIVNCFIILFSLAFSIMSVSNIKEVNELEKKNDNKSIKIKDLETNLNEVVKETNELFNSYLKLLVKNLNFTSRERISVYKEYNDRFKLIGRTSDNPRLKKKGRNTYPIDEGFIALAWEDGEYFIDDLPCPDSNFDFYYERINSINKIPKEVVQAMNMKSRTFFAYRIKGNDNEPKAVLVFESKNEKGFVKEDIINGLRDVKQSLVMFVEKNNGIELIENNIGI
ncbi:hypothetical protein [Bergeyella zoohelcum]|uniref:Uncharacterized protein n=1 Tax=Bergeyella zoohelcum TaxID=1015 RepID=A0A376BZV8_9FLAO|nr:hypothetical protein [Bergeyella zoohelcum]EKB60889.1 hypothetical protein HMPREF9700_00384 [Bergeyella zoohelcum CCUG 30536]SSZ47019.1 Uncharacterised protein [Bergeyella zoohelcum]